MKTKKRPPVLDPDRTSIRLPPETRAKIYEIGVATGLGSLAEVIRWAVDWAHETVGVVDEEMLAAIADSPAREVSLATGAAAEKYARWYPKTTPPRPCPACGCESIWSGAWKRMWSYRCSRCQFEGPRAGTEEAAVQAWNEMVGDGRAKGGAP